jgi:hypothetical protein
MTKMIAGLAMMAILIVSCTGEQKDNRLTDDEKKEGWMLLFDGSTLKGWHAYNADPRKLTWSVRQGELVCGPDARLDHIDLVTDSEYTNYELLFDWRINKEGNSGVFIDVQERPEIKATYESGPEYQLLEQSHIDNSNPLKQTGCIFNLTRQLHPGRPTKAGEWNESRIVQRDGHVEFYLDSVLTTEVDLTSTAWADSVSKTHLGTFPEFGKHVSGHIALQDWFKEVHFKNMRIRRLP